MSWKINRQEHANLWKSAVEKIVAALPKHDLQMASAVFSYEHDWMLDQIPSEDDAKAMFLAWLIPCFRKDNLPLVKWFLSYYGPKLTAEETEVLLAGSESRFDVFKVQGHDENDLKLIDTGGKSFTIETIDMPMPMEGTTLFARINSKENNRYFCPGRLIQLLGDEFFEKLTRHRAFRDSWSSLLKGFFDYLVSEEKLSEKTADNHMENANLLMMYLETRAAVDSFSKVTKPMLKAEFKQYAKKYIMPVPDMDKVYYSLYKFFGYLEHEKGVKNKEVVDWLNARL